MRFILGKEDCNGRRIDVYPILIAQDESSIDCEYFVQIPDFKGYTQGNNLADAIVMARDYISLVAIELKDKEKSVPEAHSVNDEKEPG